MDKLFARILGLLTTLIIFSSEAKANNTSEINDTRLDTNSDPHIYEIKLIPRPRPLILKQTDYAFDDTFAAHRSHSSHRSHASHVSHRSSSYAPSVQPDAPSSPAIPEKSPSTPQKSSPSSIHPVQPSKSSTQKWQSTTEWQDNSCKLYRHDVIVTLIDNNIIEGQVTECKNDSIEIIVSGSDNVKGTQWIYLKDIKALLWR